MELIDMMNRRTTVDILKRLNIDFSGLVIIGVRDETTSSTTPVPAGFKCPVTRSDPDLGNDAQMIVFSCGVICVKTTVPHRKRIGNSNSIFKPRDKDGGFLLMDTAAYGIFRYVLRSLFLIRGNGLSVQLEYLLRHPA